MSDEADRAYRDNEATEAMIRMRDRPPIMATISLTEWLAMKSAYGELRLALCGIQGGDAASLDEAKAIATKALATTPPMI